MNTPLTDKQQYWSDKLQLAEQSGYTLAEYARLNDIPVQKLYQWRSTLKSQETTTQISTESHFTRVVSTTTLSSLSVQLPNAQLRFSTLPDPAWLAELLNRYTAQP